MTTEKTDFREALIKRLADRPDLSIAALARATGVSKSQLEKLIQRRVLSTNVFDAVKIARFFGATVEEFIGAPKRANVEEILAQIRALTPEERAEVLEAQLASLLPKRQ